MAFLAFLNTLVMNFVHIRTDNSVLRCFFSMLLVKKNKNACLIRLVETVPFVK